jgi:hypothetical protein
LLTGLLSWILLTRRLLLSWILLTRRLLLSWILLTRRLLRILLARISGRSLLREASWVRLLPWRDESWLLLA